VNLLRCLALLTAIILAGHFICAAQSTAADEGESAVGAPPIPAEIPGLPSDQHPGKKSVVTGRVEAALIHPCQSANVGAQVEGVIAAVHFEEGDTVRKGDVVAEISSVRYKALFRKAEDNFNALKLALARAEEKLKIQEELFSLDAASREDLLKARTDAEVAGQKLKAASEDLEIARMNLEACSVRAPFSGYLGMRYKQPYEPVESLEKIFALVDSSKVYAVANVPERLLSMFRRGDKAAFEHTSGKRFLGKVDKIGKLIDPKSMTKKIYVLIDNPNGELEIGTTGSIERVQ